MTTPAIIYCVHHAGWPASYCWECLRARCEQAERERDAALAELAALKAPKMGCKACEGRGQVWHDGWLICADCKGTGETPVKGGIAAIIGHWPGDETDEEINEALRRMS
jgi:hypothetical protein